MYAATEQTRFKGKAGIKSSKGRLEIRLPRELFDGKQKSISLGLPDTSEGRAEADKRLRKVQLDIDTDKFDYSLEEYKKPHQQQKHLQTVKELYPEITLIDLWTQYVNSKEINLKETTLDYYELVVTRPLKKCDIKSPYKALELREWSLANSTEGMTKRLLTYMNAMFRWGIKYKKVTAPNPYEGMANEFTFNYEENSEANAFTPEEKEKVINDFVNHGYKNGKRLKGYSYSYYANLVKFMFMTGCRPSEALGLQWGDISNGFGEIIFRKGAVRTGKGRIVNSKKSKNNDIRTFPCSQKLRELLESIKPETAKPEDLVFPSVKGKTINYADFSQGAWNVIVDPIKPDTTPYSCRDTFITEQIAKGVAIAIIAKWVNNSVEVIEKTYLDQEALKHIRPIDD
jgi:integrase